MKRLHIAFSLLLSCTMLCAQNTQSIRGAHTFEMGTPANPEGKTILVDGQGVIVDGHPVIPVMGEIHYSRLPQQEWRRELKKMKAGGVLVMGLFGGTIFPMAMGIASDAWARPAPSPSSPSASCTSSASGWQKPIRAIHNA